MEANEFTETLLQYWPGPRASAPFRPALASRTSHPRQRLGRIALHITGHAAQKTTSISTGELSVLVNYPC